MKAFDRSKFPLILAAALGLRACSTLAARKVELGTSMEAARIALGKPDRIYPHQSPEGPVEIWAYVANDPRATPNGPRENFGPNDKDMAVEPYYYFGVEAYRIAFKDGKVVYTERVTQW